MRKATFVIIGGGIAGVSCAEALGLLSPEESCILISASPTVKTVTNIVPVSKMAAQFDVAELSCESFTKSWSSVEVIQDSVTGVDPEVKTIHTSKGEVIGYEKLCICSGARPKVIDSQGNPYVIGLRDTDSAVVFEKKISSSRRVVIVGNGGIATELVHGLSKVEIVWVIKDKHISATFIDPGAAEFFQSRLQKQTTQETNEEPFKRMKYTISHGKVVPGESGAALGPDWHEKVSLAGLLEENSKVQVEYCCEVESFLKEPEPSMGEDTNWPVFVKLTNGKVYGCDLVISATGVTPNTQFLVHPQTNAPLDQLLIMNDGGIKVNWKMESTVDEIYAAGDVCSAGWETAPQWFQMRLWTQARHMGSYAGRSMVCAIKGEELIQDFSFEMFTHVTKFFGMKVVLLGLFNGQNLDNQYELLLRVTKGVEYVKLVIKDGRLQGAVLIGDTDLEEMCENLILNQLDLTPYGEDLLNPNIDIEDYFD